METLVDQLIGELDDEAREALEREEQERLAQDREETRAKATRDAIWALVEHLKGINAELYGKFLNARKSAAPYALTPSDVRPDLDLGRLKKGETVTLASFAFYRPNRENRAIIKFVAEWRSAVRSGIVLEPQRHAEKSRTVVVAYWSPDEDKPPKAYQELPVSPTAVTRERLEAIVEDMMSEIRKSS
ncbi:hypothetical protein [Sorangium cellulosum]|uniref:hypothetical protein n=1 Tax=Sorangium cellulosum TaxID=56 RepID=UPI003D9C524A